jgi:hypothetical protein
MQGQNVSKICNTVISFFHKSTKKLGKAVEFVKRQSKLTPELFAEANIMASLSNPSASLEDMRRLIKKRGVKITKQGLHQRFNSNATELMKNLFTESLLKFKTEKRAVIDLLKPFSAINMIDSSGVSLPSNMKDLYQGYGGGSSSEAGLKIQVLLNYMDGQIEKVTLTDARQPDQKFKDYFHDVKKDALYLQDLGYFDINTFAAIQAKGAYFISRYLPQTKLYHEDGKEINLLRTLREYKDIFSQIMWLHKKKGGKKVQVRLVASRLQDNEYEKRLRKINQAAKKSGRMPMKETLELARWSIFITNINKEILNDQEIYIVYSLRWQIELFFKVCKGQAGINKVNGKTSDRVHCDIYAKLICIIMLMYICFPERWQENQEISFFKAFNQLRQSFSDFFRALNSAYLLTNFLKEFSNDLKDFALKEKPRKKRQATYQKLMIATNQGVLA